MISEVTHEQPLRLILASASPARQKLLVDSGISFEVIVSSVDEDAVLAAAQKDAYSKGLGDISPAQTALLLAKAKAQAVAALPQAQGAFVLGCDSVFEHGGLAFGKPHSAQKAVERITAMSASTGQLHTGHWLVDNRRQQQGTEASALRTAQVQFAQLTPAEIAAYVATTEPLEVAGSFTIDGFGSAFITGITGEYHTVVGLSTNALRAMLAETGVSITDFWNNTH